MSACMCKQPCPQGIQGKLTISLKFSVDGIACLHANKTGVWMDVNWYPTTYSWRFNNTLKRPFLRVASRLFCCVGQLTVIFSSWVVKSYSSLYLILPLASSTTFSSFCKCKENEFNHLPTKLMRERSFFHQFFAEFRRVDAGAKKGDTLYIESQFQKTFWMELKKRNEKFKRKE